MSLAKKLNLKDGALRVVGAPRGIDLGDVQVQAKATAILLFAKTLAEVDAKAAPVLEVARKDGIAWIAYPKAGKLGTDLDRDVLWQHLQPQGVQGIRMVALDDTWSAMRFRPKGA